MKRKRGCLPVLIGVLLFAVVAAGLIGILSATGLISIQAKNLVTHGIESASTQVSLLSNQSSPAKKLNYPDPTNQSALPDSVKVTDQGETVLIRASVTEGYQIYECQASKTDASGFAWKFQAPFALLKADNAANVVHSTDPTWLYTQDGSEVEAGLGQFTKPDGTVVAANATPDTKSVPWLRLDVTAHRGKSGLFSNVDQIQRLYAVGGSAPKSVCNRDVANKHVIQSVGYTAEYVFWGREGQ
jgi:hypothetical protein